jgi:DNA-binding transcriptional MerR regulator/effector-binding domain-containing protein
VLKIGDFSRLSQVSVKTLRYYDDMGLLRPVDVDASTGYRYYSASQLPRLNRVLALKDLGLTLEQIGQVLAEGLSPAQLQGMLRLKRAELQQQVDDEQARLRRIEARLRQIEREDTMPDYDVILKTVAPQWVGALRRVVPNYPLVGTLFGELFGGLGPYGSGELLTGIVYYDDEYKESEVDAEAVVFLKQRPPHPLAVRVYELPAATMASLVHHGAYNGLPDAYRVLLQWIGENGYRVAGPNRELYLYCTVPVRQDDESYVTELQFPVEKI